MHEHDADKFLLGYRTQLWHRYRHSDNEKGMGDHASLKWWRDMNMKLRLSCCRSRGIVLVVPVLIAVIILRDLAGNNQVLASKYGIESQEKLVVDLDTALDLQIVFNNVWNNKGKGIFVDRSRFLAHDPKILDQWEVIHHETQGTSSTAATDRLQNQKQQKLCHAVNQERETVAAHGRLLVTMLMERIMQSPPPTASLDGTNVDDHAKHFEEHQHSLEQQSVRTINVTEIAPSVCEPTVRQFVSRERILNQSIFVAFATKQHLEQLVRPRLPHLLIACPLRDAKMNNTDSGTDDEHDLVWLRLLVDNIPIRSSEATQTKAPHIPLHNQTDASRWLVVSFYLSKNLTTTKASIGAKGDDDGGDDSSPTPPFCKGMPMVMFMGGFQRSLTSSSSSSSSASNKEPQSCLSYFFPSWKLLNAGKLKGAMVYSFLLAFLTEGLFAIRAVVLKHVVKGRKTLLILLYVIQQAMGYIIMLVAMMYSVELFVSVVAGLMVGHRLFVRGDADDKQIHPTSTHENQATSSSFSAAPSAENHSQPPHEGKTDLKS